MNQVLKIGITACFFHPDKTRSTFGKKTLLYLEQNMIQWVMSQGHFPVLLPPSFEDMSTEKIINFVDGVILHGGADVSPQSYGEEALKPAWSGDPIRDDYEIAIYKECRKQKKPILGTCRGAQLMNVAEKGTLFQDINTQIDDSLKHRDADIYDELFHEVEFQPQSVLSEIYKDSPTQTINSVHHQSIKELGENLVLEALCPKDGVIEGLRHKDTELNNPNCEFILGVQWHPEFMLGLNKNYIDCQLLLKQFIHEIEIRKKD